MSVWRSKFDNILRRYGHDVLLQRRVEKSGSGPHRLRDNAGFARQLERHTMRSRLSGKAQTLPGIAEEAIEGLVHNVDQVFYCRWDVNPSKGDRLYEGEPDGREVYLIDWTHAFRGPGGTVVYWAIGATLEDKAR